MGVSVVRSATAVVAVAAMLVAVHSAARAQITADGTAATMPVPRDSGPALSARRDLLAQALGATTGSPRSVRTARVDLGAAVDVITRYLNAHGIPLHHDPELSGNKGVVFSASFQLHDTLPAVDFHIGDRGPLGAFYGDGGFRLSLDWPLVAARRLALHLEGGENGAFGNWAVAGVQWHHRRLPLAIGVGMPVALDDADGPIGVIWQMRMILP